MALGGGNFTFYNKELPGSYINFVSKDRPIATFADRGYAAIPVVLDWGFDGDVFTVSSDEFQTGSMEIFGYDYTHEKMRDLRELFLNLKTGHFYRLNNGAKKAKCAMGTAKYSGIRGNDLKIVVTENVDEESLFDVITYLESGIVDRQTIAVWSEIKDNKYVVFNREWTLALNAGIPLVDGSNGSGVTGQDYQNFLDKIDKVYFNIMVCPSTEPVVKQLFVQYTKRMRDEVGYKFQLVVQDVENVDHEGVVSVKNAVKDAGASPAALVYWLAGAEASAEINEGLTNKVYDGEYEIDTDYKQRDLIKHKGMGHLLFHSQGKRISGEFVVTVRILEDVNTFTTFVPKKNNDFSNNQVIRVLDQVATDVATLFNESFLGRTQNDAIGRASFKSNVIYICSEYQRLRALQNFNGDDIQIDKGLNKGDVLVTLPIEPVGVMDRLYMTVVVA